MLTSYPHESLFHIPDHANGEGEKDESCTTCSEGEKGESAARKGEHDTGGRLDRINLKTYSGHHKD